MKSTNRRFTLSKHEAEALRDEALEIVKNCAVERLRKPHPDHPERFGGTEEEVQVRETEEMLAAAEVFGAIDHVRFDEVMGLPPAPEAAEIEFTKRAIAWLLSQRDEYNSMLESMRGGIEINEGAPALTFYVWVLAGMFATGSVEGGEAS